MVRTKRFDAGRQFPGATAKPEHRATRQRGGEQNDGSAR
jgi:hypothetical protein